MIDAQEALEQLVACKDCRKAFKGMSLAQAWERASDYQVAWLAMTILAIKVMEMSQHIGVDMDDPSPIRERLAQRVQSEHVAWIREQVGDIEVAYTKWIDEGRLNWTTEIRGEYSAYTS